VDIRLAEDLKRRRQQKRSRWISYCQFW
jgi:hypothetical protein